MFSERDVFTVKKDYRIMSDSRGNFLIYGAAALILAGLAITALNVSNPLPHENGGEPPRSPLSDKGNNNHSSAKKPQATGSKPRAKKSDFQLNQLKNAAVVGYLIRYHDKSDFDFEVHESLKWDLPRYPVHKYAPSRGFKSGPDLIRTSKKGRETAFEIQYSKNYYYFTISDGRYNDLNKYHQSTGGEVFWVICRGGHPLNEDETINLDFDPPDFVKIPFTDIVKGKKYYLKDLKAKYPFFKGSKIVEK